ncbi:MAG: hypothetical protein ACKPGH_08090, partial [Dolichospermum sp.]
MSESGILSPITHYPLPITHYQLPITHYQLPINYSSLCTYREIQPRTCLLLNSSYLMRGRKKAVIKLSNHYRAFRKCLYLCNC